MYIFGQFAVAPALMLFTFTGIIDPLMKALPWLNNFPVLFVISFAIMYLIGWGFHPFAWGFSNSASSSKDDHRDAT
jgi:hypothetical protein